MFAASCAPSSARTSFFGALTRGRSVVEAGQGDQMFFAVAPVLLISRLRKPLLKQEEIPRQRPVCTRSTANTPHLVSVLACVMHREPCACEL
jgi:hypothetical protein